MKKNLIQRAITGVLFVAIIIGATLFSPVSFSTMFIIISALTVYEFGQLVNNISEYEVEMNKNLNMLGSTFLFIAIMGYCVEAIDAKVFIPYSVLMLYIMIRELYLKKKNPILNWAFTMLSQIYIALPFAMLNILAFHVDSTATLGVSFNPILPLSVFIFLWLNDSGAYFIGTLLGKHRLFERISPKKSWEGSIGGGVIAIIGATLFSYWFPFMTIFEWIGLALVVVVFGTWGDLTESLFKRQLNIKDSGSILPGHGGMLDRFDSALMAIPAAVAYLYFITLIQ